MRVWVCMCLLWCACALHVCIWVCPVRMCPCMLLCVCACVCASRCLHLHTCCIQMSSIRWGKERENMPNGEPNIFSICVCAPERPAHICTRTNTHARRRTNTYTACVCLLSRWRLSLGRVGGRLIHVLWCRCRIFIYIYSTLSPYGRKFLSTH